MRYIVLWYGGIITFFSAIGAMLGISSAQLFIPFLSPEVVTRVGTWTIYDIQRATSYRQEPDQTVRVVETCTIDVGLHIGQSVPHVVGYPAELRIVYENLPCDFKIYLKLQKIVNKPMRCIMAVPVRRTFRWQLVEERRTNGADPPDRLRVFAQMPQVCD